MPIAGAQTRAAQSPRTAAAVAASAHLNGPLFFDVETANGIVRGMANTGIKAFRGIPYGADTGGKNRFMPPRKPAAWTGVRPSFGDGSISPCAVSIRGQGVLAELAEGGVELLVDLPQPGDERRSQSGRDGVRTQRLDQHAAVVDVVVGQPGQSEDRRVGGSCDPSRSCESMPRSRRPGPTRPAQVLPISCWTSPWFQAKLGTDAGGAARTGPACRTTVRGREEEVVVPNRVNVGVRFGSALTMCSACSSTGSAMLTVSGTGWPWLDVRVGRLSAWPRRARACGPSGRSSRVAVDVEGRGVVVVDAKSARRLEQRAGGSALTSPIWFAGQAVRSVQLRVRVRRGCRPAAGCPRRRRNGRPRRR